MMRRINLHVILIASLVVVYIAVRLWRLDATCLWFDEMYSVHAAEHSWDQILSFIGMDLVHPPLFYLLLKVWVMIGGESIFWVRMLPVVFSAMAIAPFLLLVRELALPRWTHSFALLLLASNGSLIKYTQEVRMYTMLMFLSLVSLWLFSRFLLRGTDWTALVIVNLVLVYTHYFGWLVIGSEILALAIFERARLRRGIVMGFMTLVAFLPWLIYVLAHARTGLSLGQNIYWIRRPTVPIFLNFLLDLIEPFYFQANSLEATSIFRVTLPIATILLGATITYFSLAKDTSPFALKFLAWFSFVPLGIALIASWILPYSVWGTRHLIIIVGPIVILIAFLIMSIPASAIRACAATLMLLLTGYGFFLQAQRSSPEYIWCGWEPLIDGIEPPDHLPVKVYTSENLAAYHSWFATRDDRRFEINIVRPQEPSQVDREYFPPRGNDRIQFVEVTDIHDSNIVLIYRTEPALKDWLRHELELRGYRACETRTKDFRPSTAYRLEMTRADAKCKFR